jgi:NADP-dependent 3-hydroxy acid dehydrogenase YdfG
MPAPTTATSIETKTATKVLLTGASSGIGAALATELCRRGHHVWLGARRVDKLQDLVEVIGAAGGTAHAVTIDVTDHVACAAAIVALDQACGGFDVVIANAGVGGRHTSVWRTTPEDAKEVIDTNLTGALATILPLLPLMRERGRGHVVGMSSLAADLTQPMAAVYGASKSALTYFLDSVAPELEQKGIAVTIVHPGFVKSEMTSKNRFPMPFLVDTDVAARQIADAIVGRRAWLRFPLPLSMTMGVANLLPRSWRARLVAGGAAK